MIETKKLLASFARDTRGAVFIYVTILLPALIGFALLAIDGGRLFNLQTSLQAAADGFALAGAAELDGRSTAIVRANNAINTLVENQSKFSMTGLANVTVASRRYLHSLPARDDEPIGASHVTNDPAEARFVEVVVTPATLNALFPLWVNQTWQRQTATTGAVAVAGFSLTLCKVMPLFMCNPYEGLPLSIFDAAASPDHRRKQVHLRFLGPDAAYFPGDFAWLAIGGGGAKNLAENLGKTSPDTCFSSRGVETEPGQKQGAMAGINVRFDLYEGMMAPPDELNPDNYDYTTDPQYLPARNVRKGYSDSDADPATTCDQALDSPPNMGLPRDGCYATGTCPAELDGRIGDGVWPCQDYWDTNFSDSGQAAPAGCTNSPTMSRYEMYLHEMANNLVAHQNPTGGEMGEPSCSLTAPPPNTPDRRLIRGAIINCLEEAPLNGRESDVPVLVWAEFFITEPVIRNGPDGDLYLELVRLVEPDPGETGVHDDVQLYR